MSLWNRSKEDLDAEIQRLAIALAASFLPTLRISRINPAETLRSE